MNRRSLLKFMGMSPITAPLAAKAAEDMAIGGQMGMERTFGLGENASPGHPISGSAGSIAQNARAMMQIPSYKDALTSEIYAAERYVFHLDIDLANKRSFSMAAKITYQRQRNVQKKLEELQSDTPSWYRAEDMIRDFAKNLLGFK